MTSKRITSQASRLSLILILYLLLAVGYSVVVPIGRGADEWAHYHYARFIAQTGRLPLTAAERDQAGYKSDWPPLYHLLAAGLTAGIETTGPPTFKYRADHLRRQMITPFGPEAILHTRDEVWPWQQEILIWHLGRLLSIGLTAGTLIVTYCLARDIFGRLPRPGPLSRERLALVTVACLAFNPRFLFTGMLFNYDSLTLLMSALFFWMIIRVVISYQNQPKAQIRLWAFPILGGLAGLALMTKYLTVLLFLEIILMAWLINRPAAGRLIGQAMVAFLLLITPWFTYLILTFHEIDTYGPVLGTLAPLIRGDGSDRTVEELFAWLSGGQTPPPAHIDRQSYTVGQILAELPMTFWGNPISRPYPLQGFIMTMTLLTGLAAGGLVKVARQRRASRLWLGLLLFHCLLPTPLMLLRLFGARDALEAVQGRHILFLAGPAWAILFVIGLAWLIPRQRWLFQLLLAILLTAGLRQLLFMQQTYPPLLPVQTTPPNVADLHPVEPTVTLKGGAELLGYRLRQEAGVLQVALLWRGGPDYAPQDYLNELQLVADTGTVQANWLGYQTEGRYPTRAWEAGDYIWDEMALPVVGLPADTYRLQWRLVGQETFITLTDYALPQPSAPVTDWRVWPAGRLTERATVQLSCYQPADCEPAAFALLDPQGQRHQPVRLSGHQASFIIEPHWPAGAYHLAIDGRELFRVVNNYRQFKPPSIPQPLNVSFAGQFKLLGYDLPTRYADPGGGLPLTLYWQAETWLGEDLIIFVRLLDDQQQVWGSRDRRPQENYSTLYLAPRQVITDGFALPIEPATPPGVYRVELGLYREVAGQAESLSVINPATGQPTGETSVTLGPFKIGGPPPAVTVQQAEFEQPVGVAFGEQIELLGYNLRFDCSAPGERCQLIWQAYWQPLTTPATDYTLFLHLRNQAGEVVAQKDQPPTGSQYPTSLWQAGEIIRDELQLSLAEVPTGTYHLVIGLYEFTTGQRLPVPGSADNGVLLAEPLVVE